MKKLSLVIVAFAAMIFASCGNKTNADAAGQDSDTIVKSFEQSQIEQAIKMHLDSIAAQLSSKQIEGIDQSIKAGTITLTAEEKKVKPTYLLDPAIANDLQTVYQKYAALAILSIDKSVAGLYEMDVKPFDDATAKLLVDVNDPAIKKLNESKGSAQENIKLLSTEMEKEGRINFFWIGSCAATIENLYIMSQNADLFLADMNDDQVANITFRLVLIIDALEDLSQYDAEIQGLVEAIQPLKKINATTREDLKKELAEVKDDLAKSRNTMLQ